MVDWNKLIRDTAKKQEDSILIPFNQGREWNEENQDNYTWFFQNDISPQERAYDATLPEPKPIERRPF